MKYASYTDEDRAKALLALSANGGNVSKTARQLDIPYSTLWTWANKGEKENQALYLMFKMAVRAMVESLIDNLPDASEDPHGMASLIRW